jgi:hypothetical protein
MLFTKFSISPRVFNEGSALLTKLLMAVVRYARVTTEFDDVLNSVDVGRNAVADDPKLMEPLISTTEPAAKRRFDPDKKIAEASWTVAALPK